MQFRDAVRLLNDPTSGKYCFGSWQVLTGGNDGTTPLPGIFIASTGWIHPGTKGGYLEGKALAAFMVGKVPAINPYNGATFANSRCLDGQNFLGNTGDAISVADLAATGVTASRMVVDGSTTWAEMTFNTTAAPTLRKLSDILPSNIMPGVTTVRSILKVKLHAGTTNVRALEVQQVRSGNLLGTSAGTDCANYASNVDYGPIPTDQDIYMTLLTPPVVADASATMAEWLLNVRPDTIGAVAQTMVGKVSAAYGGMIVA